MKNSTSILAVGLILFGLSSCSSTTTETTDTSVTTETVASNMTATDTSATRSGTVTDTLASPATATGSLAEDPTNFVLLAGSLDLLESRTSKEALVKAKNADVKNFAQQVLSDHSQISQELKGMAAGKKLKYPADLLAKHQLLMNRLMEERPKEFDKTYMEVQEAVHKEFEELFEDASKRHSDPEMQAFASRNLTTMRLQLENTKKVKDLVD